MDSDFYKTKNWKSLDTFHRANLLLVIEGLKRGATIENDPKYVEVTEMCGLSCKRDDSLHISTKDNLRALYNKFEEFNVKTFYEATPIWGWFYSFPECCTKEFMREKTPQEKRMQEVGYIGRNNFGKEINDLIMEEHEYPQIWDYAIYVPCSIHCEESIDLLTSWKNALDNLDLEASESLSRFNKGSLYWDLAGGYYIH